MLALESRMFAAAAAAVLWSTPALAKECYGDDVIKLFAATANSSLRLTDFVVRLAGRSARAICGRTGPRLGVS